MGDRRWIPNLPPGPPSVGPPTPPPSSFGKGAGLNPNGRTSCGLINDMEDNLTGGLSAFGGLRVLFLIVSSFRVKAAREKKI